MPEVQTVNIPSLSAMEDVARQLVKIIQNYRIVCFYGVMGAGKTTLIKALCRQMGVADNVSSPTFALVNEYRDGGNSPVYHFDFYRINKIDEVFDFGYEEYFYGDGGICLIEWPELIENILPREGVVRLTINVNDDLTRTVHISIC